MEIEYPGSDFDHSMNELLAVRHIKPSDLALERRLYDTKWFDYRLMHPTQATMLFHDYVWKGQDIAFKRYFDESCWFGFRRTYKMYLFNNKPAFITGVWKARQTADAIGCPYKFFVDNCYIAALEKESFKMMPKPAQFYFEDIVEYVTARWEESQRAIIRPATDEIYNLSNYVGSREQEAYQDYLLKQIARKVHKEYALKRFLIDVPQLVESKAVEAFGDEAIERAKQLEPI